MLILETLDAEVYRVDDVVLSWSYEDTAESLLDYSIDVYRSEAPIEGLTISGYTLIASGLSGNTLTYTDTTVSGYFHHNRDWYYKLLITNDTTLEQSVQTSVPAYLNKPGTLDRAYVEILRRKGISLEKKTGRTFYLLKRYTVGTHCTECWDPITYRITESDCPVCYGTGWVNGYFNSIEFLAMTNDAPKYNEITMFGNFMPTDIILLALNFPLFKVQDVVVDDNNDRWIVQDIRSVRKYNKILEQRVHLALIMEDDIIYSIPLI